VIGQEEMSQSEKQNLPLICTDDTAGIGASRHRGICTSVNPLTKQVAIGNSPDQNPKLANHKGHEETRRCLNHVIAASQMKTNVIGQEEMSR
jgi:hypothetical protein